jgi:hypothetical protein
MRRIMDDAGWAAIKAELAAFQTRRTAIVTEHVATYGPDWPIVLRCDQPEVTARPWRGAVIHPSNRHPGKWQVTCFDADGFSSDYTVKDLADGVNEQMTTEWYVADPAWFEELAASPRFVRGCRYTLWWQNGHPATPVFEEIGD